MKQVKNGTRLFLCKMKRILLLLLACLPIVTFAWSGWDGSSSDQSWYSENQTEFQIFTAAELKGFADLVNSGTSFEGKTVYLMDDIDLNNYYWTPIGTTYNSFAGNFDGGNHRITLLNINVKKSSSDETEFGYFAIGFFGYASKGEIRNLSISGTLVTTLSHSSLLYVGFLAGFAEDIYNVKCDASIYINEEFCVVQPFGPSIGGIAGHANSISYSRCTGKIVGGSSVIWNNGEVKVGGLAGRCSTVSQCESSMNIELDKQYTNAYTGSSNCRFSVTGITSYATTISNVIFKGSITLYNANSNFDSMCGIAYHTDVVSNSISVPSSISGASNSCFNAMIVNTLSNYMENCYYRNDLGLGDPYGISSSNEELQSGTPLLNYDTSIWSFKAGRYPTLKALIQKYVLRINNDNGAVGFLVQEGESANLRIDANNGWMIDKVYANNDDVTDRLNGNILTFSEVTGDAVISVIYKSTSSDIHAYKKVSSSLRIKDGSLSFEGFSNGERVTIYNVNGMKEAETTINNQVLLPLDKGIHIVKIGKTTYKVAL